MDQVSQTLSGEVVDQGFIKEELPGGSRRGGEEGSRAGQGSGHTRVAKSHSQPDPAGSFPLP